MFKLAGDMGINGLIIDGKEIRCIIGTSGIAGIIPYIKPKTIEAILPDMVSLAKHFDSCFR